MPEMKQNLKRKLKSVRNLFTDPLPRDKTLSFIGGSYDNAGIDLVYEAKSKKYVTRINLPASLAIGIPQLPVSAWEQVLNIIGVAFSTSFFKISDFPLFEMKTGSIDSQSQKFFQDSLVKGLGEFRYLNGLRPDRPIRVKSANGKQACVPTTFQTDDMLLMLNGGGKDTIVAAEMLKMGGQPFTWVTINPNAARRRVIELSGVAESIEISYQVDQRVNKHNAYPWGHLPHTIRVLALGLLVAMLTGARYVAAGNEYSSNFGNMNYNDMEVNHQYTKSYEFEKGFSDFVKRNITQDIHVFSLLRPFHDLQLAKLFAKNTSYFPHFISCNKGISGDYWCKSCPKCAFVLMALYPFAGPEGIKQIFGEDPIHRPSLRKHMVSLVSGADKPWECVGTLGESRLALYLMLKRNPGLKFDSSPSREELEGFLKNIDVSKLSEEILEKAQAEHILPKIPRERINNALSLMGEKIIL